MFTVVKIKYPDIVMRNKSTENPILFGDTVYVGRGPRLSHINNTPVGMKGWLGNPYMEGTLDPIDSIELTREDIIELFRIDFYIKLESDHKFKEAVLALDNGVYKKLGCWCSPLPCHAQVIADYLNNVAIENEQEALDYKYEEMA